MLIFSVSFQFLRMTTEVVPEQPHHTTAISACGWPACPKPLWRPNTHFIKNTTKYPSDPRCHARMRMRMRMRRKTWHLAVHAVCCMLCRSVCEKIDSCEIRTHAGCPNNLAGYRLNHSAKLSHDLQHTMTQSNHTHKTHINTQTHTTTHTTTQPKITHTFAQYQHTSTINSNAIPCCHATAILTSDYKVTTTC
jgi:hypothetical protein